MYTSILAPIDDTGNPELIEAGAMDAVSTNFVKNLNEYSVFAYNTGLSVAFQYLSIWSWLVRVPIGISVTPINKSGELEPVSINTSFFSSIVSPESI